MDIYVLDRNFEKIDLVEGYVSFIWTERWASFGDFQITVPHRHLHARRLLLKNYLYIEESRTLMRIERIEKTGESGQSDLVTVSGRSILALLLDKIHPSYQATFRPYRIAINMVNRVCVTGTAAISDYDIIPNLEVSAPEAFGRDIDYETGPVDLYTAVEKLAKEHDFGFLMEFDLDSKMYTFRVSNGRDLRDSLHFSPKFGTLNNVKFLRSIENWKDHAYVTHRDLDYVTPVNRYGWGGTSGINRHAILVDAGDLENPTYERLVRVGREALREYDEKHLVDGVFETEALRYNVDYYLGDRVKVSTDEEDESEARITEFIWSHDSTGFHSYPTFQTITP